jgi:hypothetical protein
MLPKDGHTWLEIMNLQRVCKYLRVGNPRSPVKELPIMTKNARMLAVGAALATSLAAASPASAALIVNPVIGGPFSPANPVGTIPSTIVFNFNTYDFTFDMSAAGSVETQMQASLVFPRLIQYSLFSGPPGSGTFIDQSALGIGPTVVQTLGPGSYYLQIDNIAQNGELVSGGLVVSAVPEPMAWTLMLVGFAGVGAALRRRAAKSAAIAA